VGIRLTLWVTCGTANAFARRSADPKEPAPGRLRTAMDVRPGTGRHPNAAKDGRQGPIRLTHRESTVRNSHRWKTTATIPCLARDERR
jgi:hypothetical protein